MARSCKNGKVPEGVRGRCIKPKGSKRCNAGKAPTGVNGRCVKIKRRYTKKQRRTSSKSATPKMNSYNARAEIYEYMSDMDDEDLFSKTEIEKFVNIAVKQKLSPSEIRDGLEQYHKSYGVFAFYSGGAGTGTGSGTENSRSDARAKIIEFMTDIDDDEFFTEEEINKFVDIIVEKNLTDSEIRDGLYDYHKGDGVFTGGARRKR
jgi:hypothetical protein